MSPEPAWAGELADEHATEALGARLAAALRPGDLILLEGPLGAGKTTLVRGLVAALGGEPGEVCSPTFVLLETYEVAAGPVRRVHHADLYRVRGRASAPVDEIGLGEALDDDEAVTAVEWPAGWEWQQLGAARVVAVSLRYDGERRASEVRWLTV